MLQYFIALKIMRIDEFFSYDLSNLKGKRGEEESKRAISGHQIILEYVEYNNYDKQMISKILVAMDGSESSLRAMNMHLF
jgi:hypothetical protein